MEDEGRTAPPDRQQDSIEKEQLFRTLWDARARKWAVAQNATEVSRISHTRALKGLWPYAPCIRADGSLTSHPITQAPVQMGAES